MISFDQYKKSAEYIQNLIGFEPEIGIVLGSGLGKLAGKVEQAVQIPYEEIPGFPRSTVESHAGVLVCGTLSGRRVVVLSGRFHYYEGYSMDIVTYYVRVLKLLGVKTLILTNAAGGVNLEYKVGDLMLITDHIKLGAESPVRGIHQAEFGNRFFDLSRLYSPRLRETAQQCADKLGIALQKGVYFYMPGPEFETPAEIRAIRILGGDAVGMSTVSEAVAAAQCGLEVLGISCITNLAAGMIPGGTVSDDEVTVAAAQASTRFMGLIQSVLEKI